MAGQCAPHFHLFLFTHGQKIDFEELSREWFEVVGSNDYAHLKAGTNCEPIREWKGVMFYAAKYLSKNAEEPTVGRVWGVFGRKRLPLGELKVTEVTPAVGKMVQRTIRRWFRRKFFRKDAPATLYIAAAPDFIGKMIKLYEKIPNEN